MGGWERGLDLSVSPCFTIRKPGKTVFSCSTLLNQNLHTYPFGMVSMFTVCGLAQNLKSLSLYIFKWKNSEMLFTYSSSTQMLIDDVLASIGVAVWCCISSIYLERATLFSVEDEKKHFVVDNADTLGVLDM